MALCGEVVKCGVVRWCGEPCDVMVLRGGVVWCGAVR